MDVDPDEVKRHLEILGYKNVQPNILKEFVKDLKKLIEYDLKHNSVNVLSASFNNKEQNQSYSDWMKSSTPFNSVIDGGPTTVSSRNRDVQPPNNKQTSRDCSLQTYSKNTNHSNRHNSTLRSKNVQSENTPPKCIFCEYTTKSQPARIKAKHGTADPSCTIYIGATFNIEL